jgi:arylsulfatase A-like enzyme
MTRRVTRRDALRTAAFGSVGFMRLERLLAQPTSRRPNIVFILADDMGYADLSCYGRPDLRTPNIDHLAENGVRFLQAYANSAVCTATRVALITGRYQYRLRVGLEEPLAAANQGIGLPPEQPTIASLLKRAGYGTTLIGKWHLGKLPKFGPLQSGYDHFYGFRGSALDYYSHQGTDHKDDLWDDDVPVHQAGYLTDLLGARAIDVVNDYAKSHQPFFISLHFNAPHWPWEAPGDEAESERLKARSLTAHDSGTQKTYQRMIEQLDLQVGRVLQALDQNALTDNTIVVFTSDNGGERFADTWPFTGRKTELLEGGLRIPAIISWPARLPKGTTSDQVAMSMDWLPTFLSAAGGRLDPQYSPDGVDLLPMLSGTAPILPRTLFWRFKANAQRAARDGDFKYLKILENTFLFNVVEDPMERANLKERKKDVYERLEGQWLNWNETMLPEVEDSFTQTDTGDDVADRPGSRKMTHKPDNPPPAKRPSKPQ